jgi:signal peptidase I
VNALLEWLTAVLAWVAWPVAILCVIDDWFLRTGRQLRVAEGAAIPDPPLMKVAYAILPVLVLAGLYRLMGSQRTDFSLVLLVITFVSGIVWAIDRAFLQARRAAAARAAGRELSRLEIPGTVDYARSFFPIMATLLVLRSFVYEPYRIPSDSMMPTLLDGDFILVNKYAYGLRWPVSHAKFLTIGAPERGDVTVFRWPVDPSVNYVKRVVGLPGDLVEVRADQLIINGQPVPLVEKARYSDGCYLNMRLADESLGKIKHEVLHCVTPDMLAIPPLASCNRNIGQSYLCNESSGALAADMGDRIMQVPKGQYLMIGDNRDNSSDGRIWGFVDESLLVGKATRIWFNWDLQRSGGPNWGRIGQAIE